MRKTLLAAYLCLALVAVMLMVWAIPAFTPKYSGYGMHPGVLPYMLAGLLFVCALVCAWKTWRTMQAGPDPVPSPLPLKSWIHLTVYTVVLLLAMPLMERAGFFLGSVIVLVVLQLLAGQRRIGVLLGVSIGVSGVTWGILQYILHAPLP